MCEQIPNVSALMLSSLRRKYFMLDPNFPKRLLEAGNERTMEFIQFLSTEYSKRGLTKKTDRCAAISGLESRIAQAKNCETRFGIFQPYLHRSLLWQRSERQSTSRIDYEDQIIPSWSWMAYSGSIQFMDIPFGRVEWMHSLRFNKRNKYGRFNKKWKPALVTDVGSFQGCNSERKGTGYAILDLDGNERGHIQYDTETYEQLDAERCVVVGRDSRKDRAGIYYILVARSTGRKDEYIRVGTGWVQSYFVARQGVQASIV